MILLRVNFYKLIINVSHKTTIENFRNRVILQGAGRTQNSSIYIATNSQHRSVPLPITVHFLEQEATAEYKEIISNVRV